MSHIDIAVGCTYASVHKSKAPWGGILVKRKPLLLLCGLALTLGGLAQAQVPPTPAPEQMALLKSSDPKLAANKKLVFDMWRAVIQGGHTEMAEQ